MKIIATVASLLVKIAGDNTDFQEKLEQTQKSIEGMKSKRVTLEADFRAANKEIGSLGEKIKRLRGEIKLSVDSEAKAELKKTLDEAKAKIAELKGKKITIGADLKELDAAIKSSAGSLAGLEKKAEQAGKRLEDLERQGQSIGRGILAGAAAGAAALGGLGVAAVKMASDMEQSQIAFATLLGSADTAKGFLQDLADFAAGTPFNMPGLIDASKRLLAFGFQAKEIIPLLTNIGDAVGAVGGDTQTLDRVTLAFGQMRAAGKVMAQDMMQLVNAGLPAWDMLAKAAGKSIAEIKDLASKGALDANAAIAAMMSEMGSRFGGAMEAQSKTISGLLSNIEDEVGSTMVLVGQEITEAFDLKEVLGEALREIGSFKGKVKASGLRQALIDEIPAEAVAAGVGTVAAALAMTLKPALIAVATAAKAMWVAMGPVGLAVTAIAAGAAYFAVEGERRGVGKLDSERDKAMASYDAGEIDDEEYDRRMADINQREQANAAQAADAVKEATDALSEHKDAAKAAGSAAEDWAGKLVTGGKSAGSTMNKLANEVKSVHDRIQRDWLSETQSKEAQAVAWYESQLAALEKSKEANANYQEDLLKLEATYAEKRRKAREADAQKDYDDYKKRADTMRSVQDGQTGRDDRRQSLGIADDYKRNDFNMVADFDQQRADMERGYQDLMEKFKALTAEERQNYLDAWADADVQVREMEDGSLDFSAQIAEEKALLNAEELEKRKALREEYYAWERDAAKTQEDYMREMNNALYGGLQTSIKGLLDGTMSLSDAWQSLKDTMINTLVQMAAQAIASNIMIALTGKPIAAGIAAAYAPAAAMVSLATMGKNAVPAGLAITGTVSLAESFAHAGGLAAGGYVSGPGTATSDSVPAMLSNGEYVIRAAAVKRIGAPALDALNKGHAPRLAAGGLTGGNSMHSLASLGVNGDVLSGSFPAHGRGGLSEKAPSQQISVSIQAVDAKSVERLLRKNGGALVKSLSDQAAIFNTGKLRLV